MNIMFLNYARNEIMLLIIITDICFQDPVCGTAHCGLASYWSKKLGKCDLNAYQVSVTLAYFTHGLKKYCK
jgi:hypothetical protein